MFVHRYLAHTRKGRFKQQLVLNTNLLRWYKELYQYRIFRTDWSEDDLHSLYILWQTAEERRRQLIMYLMCY
jgi:hypothetical protein